MQTLPSTVHLCIITNVHTDEGVANETVLFSTSVHLNVKSALLCEKFICINFSFHFQNTGF